MSRLKAKIQVRSRRKRSGKKQPPRPKVSHFASRKVALLTALSFAGLHPAVMIPTARSLSWEHHGNSGGIVGGGAWNRYGGNGNCAVRATRSGGARRISGQWRSDLRQLPLAERS